MKKTTRITLISLHLLMIIFLSFFLFENIYSLNFLANKWEESTFIHEFTLLEFNFFSRLVKHLMVVMTFYRIDLEKILSLFIYGFRAIGVVEGAFLLYGLGIFYLYHFKEIKKLKIIDMTYAIIFGLFAIKILTVSFVLYYSQYMMTLSFLAAMRITYYVLLAVSIIQGGLIALTIFSLFRRT